jgi:hypothetical protein
MPGAISVNTPQDRRFGQPAIVGYVALLLAGLSPRPLPS